MAQEPAQEPRSVRVGLRGDGWVDFSPPELPWDVQALVQTVDGIPQLLGLHLEPRRGQGIPVREQVISAERLRSLPLAVIRRTAVGMMQLDFDEVSKALTTRLERQPGQPGPMSTISGWPRPTKEPSPPVSPHSRRSSVYGQ